MAKMIFRFALLYMVAHLYAKDGPSSQPNIFERNCMRCHKQMSLTMQKIFMRYLLKYSSEVSVKSALFDFLKNPNYLTSALRPDQIARYGLKNRTNLNDEELQEAIDTYWEKYKVFGKLK